MGKIVVIGVFGYANNQLDGQTIKTRNVYNLLCERYEGNVVSVDTQELKRKPWMIFMWLKHIVKCQTLILLPCLNNLTYFFPPLFFYKGFWDLTLLVFVLVDGKWSILLEAASSRHIHFK